MTRTTMVVSLFSLLLYMAPTASAQTECPDSGGLGFICGLNNAEDLVAVPGTNWIIASAMAESQPSAFYLIDAEAKRASALYTADTAAANHDRSLYGMCPGAPVVQSITTHGLSIETVGERRARLYAVSHGAREAIEVFDVDSSGERPRLTWIGCVPMPDGLDANSIATMRDGSILATVLALPGTSFESFLAGELTGAVYRWTPGDEGFTVVEGMELPGNNGIEVSLDETEVYVVSSGVKTVTAFTNSNPARRLRSTRTLEFTPDNVRLSPDGLLLTGGMIDDEPTCGGTPHPDNDNIGLLATCPRGFIVATINPRTMVDTTIARGPANPAFSNATIGIVVNNAVWIGSFAGDRVGWRMLP